MSEQKNKNPKTTEQKNPKTKEIMTTITENTVPTITETKTELIEKILKVNSDLPKEFLETFELQQLFNIVDSQLKNVSVKKVKNSHTLINTILNILEQEEISEISETKILQIIKFANIENYLNIENSSVDLETFEDITKINIAKMNFECLAGVVTPAKQDSKDTADKLFGKWLKRAKPYLKSHITGLTQDAALNINAKYDKKCTFDKVKKLYIFEDKE